MEGWSKNWGRLKRLSPIASAATATQPFDCMNKGEVKNTSRKTREKKFGRQRPITFPGPAVQQERATITTDGGINTRSA